MQRFIKFSCSPEKWAYTWTREVEIRKPKEKSFEIIMSVVIKYQWKILKLQKSEFNNNLFNLQNVSFKILRTLYGGCFWHLTSTIVSMFQRAKLLKYILRFLFLLLNVKNSSVFTNVSNDFQNLLVLVTHIYLSWESVPFILWILSLYYLAF